MPRVLVGTLCVLLAAGAASGQDDDEGLPLDLRLPSQRSQPARPEPLPEAARSPDPLEPDLLQDLRRVDQRQGFLHESPRLLGLLEQALWEDPERLWRFLPPGRPAGAEAWEERNAPLLTGLRRGTLTHLQAAALVAALIDLRGQEGHDDSLTRLANDLYALRRDVYTEHVRNEAGEARRAKLRPVMAQALDRLRRQRLEALRGQVRRVFARYVEQERKGMRHLVAPSRQHVGGTGARGGSRRN